MSIASGLRRAMVGGVAGFGRSLLRRPQLKYLAKRMLALFPSLRTRVQNLMYQAALASQSRLSNRVKDDADLSPRTVRMLHVLQRAASRQDLP